MFRVINIGLGVQFSQTNISTLYFGVCNSKLEKLKEIKVNYKNKIYIKF